MNGGLEDLEMVLAARVEFEAALIVSCAEDARHAWRFYHHALANQASSASLSAARRWVDDAVNESGDEQLVQAKRRYDAAVSQRELNGLLIEGSS